MPFRRKLITLRLGRRRDEFGQVTRDFGAVAAYSNALPRTQQQRVTDILHDLKSPLARLNVALGLARQQSGVEAQDALDRIELEAEKLSQMLQQLLGQARAELGMAQTAAREFDLLSLVKEVAADANFEAMRANRTVRLLPCGSCKIHAVRDMLRSVIENVARNAVAHTAERTAVEISVTRPENGKSPFAIVSVRDHGQGVPPAFLEEIFRPFFRVEDSPCSELRGSGLGLAIAERAVRLHGGSIAAANHSDGGLVVEIRLPIRSPSETNIAIAPASPNVLDWPLAIE